MADFGEWEQNMQLEVVKQRLAVCKLSSMQGIDWQDEICFFSRTDQELSLVCQADHVPETAICAEKNWRAFRICGQLDFALVGILSRIAGILTEAGISIFAVSTYDTDYVLIREENFDRALMLLGEKGYTILK